MLLIGFTLALLCFSSAAAGALLSVPPDFVLSPASYRGASFEPALGEFLAEPYIEVAAKWLAGDGGVLDQFEIATTLGPDDIRRIEKDTTGIDSGKNVFRTPEPPAVVMLLIGAGLIAGVKCSRPAHRRGCRRVRKDDRQMAHI
jgi:hypothetical protein